VLPSLNESIFFRTCPDHSGTVSTSTRYLLGFAFAKHRNKEQTAHHHTYPDTRTFQRQREEFFCFTSKINSECFACVNDFTFLADIHNNQPKLKSGPLRLANRFAAT
jgi:hypothetical protein